MEHIISINTMEEYIGKLTDIFDFTIIENENTVTLKVPENLGTGYMRVQQLSSDIAIGIMDLFLKEPLVSYYDNYVNTCELTCCLSGHIDYSETGVSRANLGKNEVGVYAIPRTRGMMMIPSGERVITVTVSSTPSFYNQLPYVNECKAFEVPAVKEALCRMAKPMKLNARLHNNFEQIMKNKISGNLKSIYLDSLGKIMLSDVWQDFIVTPLSNKEFDRINTFEQNALMEARNILNCQYITPPTIQQLARKVALNEFQLKTGFKRLFGKSIYEYVRSIRMENARYMLEDNSLTIGQIAAMVGYVNTSHFARAFRGIYGVNPKDFRFGF